MRWIHWSYGLVERRRLSFDLPVPLNYRRLLRPLVAIAGAEVEGTGNRNLSELLTDRSILAILRPLRHCGSCLWCSAKRLHGSLHIPACPVLLLLSGD